MKAWFVVVDTLTLEYLSADNNLAGLLETAFSGLKYTGELSLRLSGSVILVVPPL